MKVHLGCKKTKWPSQTFITSTIESEKETKCVKELVTTAIKSNQKSEYNDLSSKYELHKTLRILGWMYRFINNSRKVKKSGPLTTEEIERRKKYLIMQAQEEVKHSEKLIHNQKRLGLHKYQEGIYECRGRIEGAYPFYSNFIRTKTLVLVKKIKNNLRTNPGLLSCRTQEQNV